MNEVDSSPSWKKSGNWKSRYSKLYSSRCISLPQVEEPLRISFISNDPAPYSITLNRVLGENQEETPEPSLLQLDSMTSHWTDNYSRNTSNDFGEHDTMLLDMVRAKNREVEQEALDQPLDLPARDDDSDDQSMEACVHGLSIRNNTDGSVSRSRISRLSTRRDMDIPSILAFTASVTAPTPLGIPAFEKVKSPKNEEAPRWSIRRAVCPVCSQKWKDRTSITNVKNSGLRRNSSMELPSVIAPGRLRTSITLDYVPRPAQAAVDKEAGVVHGSWRNSSSSWQLTRARRFRTPKLQHPSAEESAPPGANAPLAKQNLNLRVQQFLAK